MKRTIVALALAAAACGAPQTYTAANQEAFMRGCTSRGAPEGYCSCLYQKVTQSLPFNDFASYERMSRTEQEQSGTEAKLREFAQQCAETLQSPQSKPGG